jgi:inosine-uridine nucleoside N-ribohydrolase
VDVERESSLVRGLTRWDPKTEPAPHKVALDVDPDRFVRHYFETVARLRQGG